MQQSVKQRHSHTSLRVVRFISHMQHVDRRSERQHKPCPSRLSIVGQLAKHVLWSLEHRHRSTISHTSRFEKHKRRADKGEKVKALYQQTTWTSEEVSCMINMSTSKRLPKTSDFPSSWTLTVSPRKFSFSALRHDVHIHFVETSIHRFISPAPRTKSTSYVLD